MTAATEAPASESPSVESPAPDSPAAAGPVDAPERTESPTVTGTNVEGDHNGDIYQIFKPDEPETAKSSLVEGPVPEDRITQAAEAFCFPERFADAAAILRKRHLVVLAGHSSGRTHSGIRLLIDLNLESLHHLNPTRPPKDLLTRQATTTGYLWANHDATGWSPEDCERTLDQLSERLRSQHSYLVLTFLGKPELGNVTKYVAELAAPPTAAVVQAHLTARGISDGRRAELLSEIDLETVSPVHRGPRHAAEVARLLAAVEAGEHSLADVKATLTSRADEDIQAWFEEHPDVSSRALAITVSLLEECPYYDIASAANKLEKVLANPENEEIWPYQPPDLLERSRSDRLNSVHAHVVRNASGSNIALGPVKFSRPGWGPRLLSFVWTEFERVRPVIQEWLCTLTKELLSESPAQRRALTRFGTTLASAAEPNPMQWVLPWLGPDKPVHSQTMAATVLGALCANPGYIQQIKDVLRHWSKPNAPACYRHAVAIACGVEFGKSHPEFAMTQLGRLTKNCDESLRYLIPRAVQALLAEPNNRSLVLSTAAVWLLTGGAQAQAMAYQCAIKALFVAGAEKPLTERDKPAVRLVGSALLTSRKYRPLMMRWLANQGALATISASEAAKSRYLLHTLLTGDSDFVRRFGYDLRKYLDAHRDNSRGLARQLDLIVKEI
ncbi:hypothetical protein [Amycolatopsis sp. VC5-11]|uniref:hypothetical protein n=1 Tax=Amycolatopsis sp. VC5-11 TaxID=3120156 RepID=UPI0030083048